MNLSLTLYRILFIFLTLLCTIIVRGQKISNKFKFFDIQEDDSFRLTKPLRFYEILCSKAGEHKFTSSYGLFRDKGTQLEIILYTGPYTENKKQSRNYLGEDSIRTMYEAPGKMVYFVSQENRIFFQPSTYGGLSFAPIVFPPSNNLRLTVSKIWIDSESNIYIGTKSDNFYFIESGAIPNIYNGELDNE